MHLLILATNAPVKPTWVEHYDLVPVLIGVMWLIIAWLVKRQFDAQAEKDRAVVNALRGVTETQKEIFERVHNIEKDLYIMMGEHRSNHGKAPATSPRPYPSEAIKAMENAMRAVEDVHAKDAEDSDRE